MTDTGEGRELIKAITMIGKIKKIAKQERKIGGTIECPKCGGEIQWAIASNGHTRGKCNKYGCLSWIE